MPDYNGGAPPNQRQSTSTRPEAFQNLYKLAQLVAATAATVAAEGAENFIEYCEKAKAQFGEAGMRPRAVSS